MSKSQTKSDALVQPGLLDECEMLNQRVAELERMVEERGPSEVQFEHLQDSLEKNLQTHTRELKARAEIEKLRQTIATLKATLDSSREGILVLDNEGKAIIHNQRFLEQWRVTDERLASCNGNWLEILAAPLLDDPERFIARTQGLIQQPEVDTRDVLRFTDGRIFESHSHPHKVNGETLGRVWSFHDATDQQRAQKLVEYQATYDHLTDLPNRRLLLDRLNQMLARCRRHNRIGALLFLDLDNFKTINDTLGHPTGDALLQQVAKRLNSCLRREDTAARLGGDEFVLLLSECEGSHEDVTKQVDTAAKKVLETLSEPYEVHGHRMYSTPSIGVTLFPQDGETADDVLMHADTAMYRAKDAGRNTIRFFLPSMQQASQDHLQMQNDLRQALDNDELKVFWQPQLNQDGVVIGAEGLLRWEHPKRGLVMPGEFIRVAEEMGIVTSLGNKVLEDACLLLCKLSKDVPEQGPVFLSVNVSPQQFQQADFSMQVAHFLETTGANPSHLTLELTENMLVSSLEEVMAKMDDLKRLGVRFSIDDFGTGYSSLTYLKRLPLNEIKIDRSFVCDLIKDHETVSIVEAIITMGIKLGLGVVAEGVESRKEFDFLKKRGCHYFQGNLFSEPLPEEDFWAFLKHQSAEKSSIDGSQSAFEGF